MLAIVVDSTAYLTKKEARLHGIQVLSARYSVNGELRREQYIDLPCAEAELYSPDSQIRTFQTPAATYSDAFRQLLSHGYDVLCLTISSKMSSACESARRAALRQKEPERVRVVDSELTIGGLYMLAKKARIFDREGFSLAQIAEAMEYERRKLHIRFTLDDLSMLEGSKRIAVAPMSAAPVLNNAPVFICREGGICLERMVRKGQNRTDAMLADIPESAAQLSVNYVEKTPCFYSVMKQLAARFPHISPEIRKIGPVVGVSTGRSVLAIVWEE